MAIEQIISYLKENHGRYSAEQLRQALLKAGYPAQDIDEAMRIAAEGGGIAKAATVPRQSVGAKILLWFCGFFFAGFFIGAIINISFWFFPIFGFGGGSIGGIFGGYFNYFIIGGIAIIAEIFIFFRVRRRFVYFARGMLAAIIMQIVAIVAIIILFFVVAGSLNVAREKSRDARRVADIGQMQLGLELYFDANNRAYPNDLSELAPKFIPSVPHDPLSNQPYGYEKKPDGSYYLKAELEEPTNYALQNDINPGNQFYEVSDSPQQIQKPPQRTLNLKNPPLKN